MQLSGKNSFITGGASGIGKACVRLLLRNGAKVCFSDVDEENGKKAEEELVTEFGREKVLFIGCDVSDSDSFENAFQRAVSTFQQIDIMINNAGIHQEKNWKKTIAVNMQGTITGTYLALDHMRKDKGGKGGAIIQVASVLSLRPMYHVPVYTATKHAVLGFTRSLAIVPDLKQQGVRFACICPETVDTPLVADLKPDQVIEQYHPDVLVYAKEVEKLTPEKVAEGILSVIEDDDSNDTILYINCQDGFARKKCTVVDA